MRFLRTALCAVILSSLGLASQASPAAPVAALTAAKQTLEISVVGLNCDLCGPAMKAALLKATKASDLEPRLECGLIYVEVDPLAKLNEAGLSFTLASNGFNFKSVRPVAQSIAQVRSVKSC